MANRSYLYSLNESPKCLSGISEWNYAIPVSHLLLVSGSPRLVRSYIWETEMPIAITADYEEGVKRFLAFLDLLMLNDVEEKGELEKQIKEAREFLQSPKNSKQKILLEAAEILDMQDNPMDEEAKFILSEITDLAAEVDRLVRNQEKDIFNNSKNKHILDLKTEMDELGMYWSNELYFHFEDNLN